MLSYDTTFKRMLLKRLEEHAMEKQGELVAGHFCTGLPMDQVAGEYQYRRGYLKAIDIIVDLAEEIADELDRR